MSYQVLNYQAEGSAGFLEKEEWKTNIGANRNGSEVRVPVRSHPRYRFEYSIPLYEENFANPPSGKIREALSKFREHKGLWLIPLWPHLTAGANRPVVLGADERMLSLMPDGSFIESIGVPLSGAAETMPAALAGTIDTPQLQYVTDNLAMLRVSFLLTSEFREQPAAWDGPTLDGKPVWPFRLDWSESVEQEFRKNAELVDFDLAWAEHVRFIEDIHSGTVALVGEQELLAWRKFRKAVRGQAGEFWMQGPGDLEPVLYRLATDQIETAYRFSADEPWATSKVSFKRLA